MSEIKEIMAKLSEYNLFNFLLPGTIFAFLVSKLTHYTLTNNDTLISFFLYYFLGLVISRIGSLIIEPILRRTKIINFSDYKDYVSASEKDKTIIILSQENNTYRTLISLFIILIIVIATENTLPVPSTAAKITVSILALIIFVASYKKQTSYITKRVERLKKS